MKTIKIEKIIGIESIYESTSIFISLETKVEDSGVLFNKHNAVSFNGRILFTGDTCPQKFKVVNKGLELLGKKFRLSSRYNVIAPTDDKVKFPKVSWKPELEAGDHTLYDEEIVATSEDNLFEFVVTFEFVAKSHNTPPIS